MNTTENKTVRLAPHLTTRGATRTVGEDDLIRTVGKILPPELNRRSAKLRADVNNLNSNLKRVWGRLVNHPQGGLASLDDNDQHIVPLRKAARLIDDFSREADNISLEINKLIIDGSLQDRIEQIGLDPTKVGIPEVSIATTVAIDREAGQTSEGIREVLTSYHLGEGTKGFEIIDLVPQEDEKLLGILDALAQKMGEHHQKLADRIEASRLGGKPITRDDIITANFRFIHSLDGEREKIRYQLNNGRQMAQIDSLLDNMLATGKSIIDIYNDVKLSNGAAAATAADPNSTNIIKNRLLNSDESLLDSFGMDEI